MNEHGLNERQLRFADLYIELGNATQAYKEAGYEATGNQAESGASRLLRHAKVSAYIEKRLQKAHEKRVADGDEVLAFLSAVMRGEVEDEVLAFDPETARFSRESKRSDTRDRVKAGELLGKRHRLFTEQVDLNANVGVTIVDDVEGDE